VSSRPKKKKSRNIVGERRLIELLRKYKKIKISFTTTNSKGELERERILTVNGSAIVRYYYSKYDYKASPPVFLKKQWSRYETSCFAENACYTYLAPTYQRVKRNTDPARAIVQAMLSHDGRYIKPVAVYVGKGYKRQIV